MLTWRTATIVMVVILAVVVVTPSVRAYADQQEMLDGLRTEAEQARNDVADLEAEVHRWEDPAFLVAQARERLAYVFPGEVPYRVLDPETVAGPVEGSPASERTPQALASETWYESLWGSVVEAGTGEAPSADDSTEDTDGSPAATFTNEDQDEQLTHVDFGG